MVPDRLETIQAMVEPVATSLGLQIYDLVLAGGAVRLILDRPGGVDIDTSKRPAGAGTPPRGASTTLPPVHLEVSSPGRTTLRTEHFAGAIGASFGQGLRRGRKGAGGVLTAADPTRSPSVSKTVSGRSLEAIDEARTVFDWSPAPKPGKGSKPGRAKKEAVA